MLGKLIHLLILLKDVIPAIINLFKKKPAETAPANKKDDEKTAP